MERQETIDKDRRKITTIAALTALGITVSTAGFSLGFLHQVNRTDFKKLAELFKNNSDMVTYFPHENLDMLANIEYNRRVGFSPSSERHVLDDFFVNKTYDIDGGSRRIVTFQDIAKEWMTSGKEINFAAYKGIMSGNYILVRQPDIMDLLREDIEEVARGGRFGEHNRENYERIEDFIKTTSQFNGMEYMRDFMNYAINKRKAGTISYEENEAFYLSLKRILHQTGRSIAPPASLNAEGESYLLMFRMHNHNSGLPESPTDLRNGGVVAIYDLTRNKYEFKHIKQGRIAESAKISMPSELREVCASNPMNINYDLREEKEWQFDCSGEERRVHALFRAERNIWSDNRGFDSGFHSAIVMGDSRPIDFIALNGARTVELNKRYKGMKGIMLINQQGYAECWDCER